MAEELTTAVATADRAGFTDLFGADVEPDRIELLWHNLRLLDLVVFTAGELDWRVAWRLTGEDGLAYHRIEAELDCRAGSCRLLDLRQRSGAPTPIWLTQSVEVHRDAGVSVLGGPDAARWLVAGQAARGALAAAGLPRLFAPPAELVIEAPATTSAFEQVLAAPAAEFRTTGAITWLADFGLPSDGGPTADGESPVLRIVLNPDTTAGLTAADREFLLAHEASHVATNWLGPPVAGRKWVAEGLAEVVAWPSSPAERQRALDRFTSPTGAQPACVAGEQPSDAAFSDPLAAPDAYAWAGLRMADLVVAADDPEALILQLWQDSVAESPPWPGDPCS